MQYNNIHKCFIKTQIYSVVEEAIQACSCIGKGIDTYPLKDYVFQSVFLKMTGFQEQKLKCICWTMATYDFQYRRNLLNNDDGLGEYSTIEAKTKIYKRIIECINRISNKPFNIDDIKKEKIKTDVLDYMDSKRNDCIFSIWAPEDFQIYESHKHLFKINQFCSDSTILLQNGLSELYDSLYRHRNRCAHNTTSYQDNIPSLRVLSNEKFYCNYFLWFALLILIDNIFIALFDIFEQALNLN